MSSSSVIFRLKAAASALRSALSALHAKTPGKRGIPFWPALVIVLIIEPAVLLALRPPPVDRQGRTITVSATDSGSETVLHVGDRLAVHYTSLASAGFFWNVKDSDVSVLLPVDEASPPNVDAMPGAAEQCVREYAARRRGTAEIVLTCRDVKRSESPITDEMHFPVRVE